MDHEASAHDLLGRILLDESKDPTNFPIGLLKSITNDFSDEQNIGSGGFADVYKGQLQSGIVAVKKFKELSCKAEDLEVYEKKFILEVDSLMKVKHKNIVRFLGYCFDTQGKVWNHKGNNIVAEERQRFLCFEFLSQGSLDKHISDASNGLEWRTRYHIIKGICEGLHYLHGMKIVHADLKPENILLDHNMVPKIGDFGLARSFHEEQTRAITQKVFGTFGYMAPEYCRGVITFKSDIYSLGIIITEMLTGQKKDDLSIQNALENWTTRFKTSRGGTWLEHVRVCAEIGLECMEFDPKKRPATGDIIDRLAELEHKYGFVDADLLPTHVDVYPLDIWFPLESDKVIKCPVTLTNKTADDIGVWIAPTSLDAHSNPSYPYVWERMEHIKDDHRRSLLFIMLDPHSTKVIDMTMRKQEQAPVDEGMFDVMMVAKNSEKDHKLFSKFRNGSTLSLEDPLRAAKEAGSMVRRVTLKAAVTRDPPAIMYQQEVVTAHQFIQDDDGGRIGCMDVDATKKWLLVGHSGYNGYVSIWNYETQERVAKFQLIPSASRIYETDFGPIVSIKFIPGEQWFAAGDFGGNVHIYDYIKNRKINEWNAHIWRVFNFAVHPKHKLLLTWSNGDLNLWDWSQGWKCTGVFKTDICPLDNIMFGPRDTRIFATSYGSNVKVWDIHRPDGIVVHVKKKTDAIATFKDPWFTFYTDGQRDFLATFSPSEVKIWDLHTMKHVHTLCPVRSRVEELSKIAFHPTLPILASITSASRSEGNRHIVLWDLRTYRVMKRIELLMTGYPDEMLFDDTEDITSLVVACKDGPISIIKINVSTLLAGC